MIDKEQREWQRIVVNMSAKCRVVDGPPRYDSVIITDMHHQGCCLQGDIEFLKGQVIRLVLEIPFEGTINLTGEVVWAGEISNDDVYSVGIRFVIDSPMAEDMCLKLYNFCLMRQPKQ
ncbi:MAG: PilZ domain-containing protein [Candidatus Omnitrophota bacterium]